MTDMLTIKSRIKSAEGLRLRAYNDTRKYLTIGYGHKITPADGLFPNDEISVERAEQLFEEDFQHMLAGVRGLVPMFDVKPEGIKSALVEMAYNNGVDGLRKFKKFLYWVNLGEYEKAADEIVDSANYRSADLHSRYKEIADTVRKSNEEEA